MTTRVGGLLLLVVCLGGCGSDGDTFDGTCKTSGPHGLMGCVEQARYEADLQAIAAPRVPGSAHWQETQDLCATRLADLGFTVERHDYGTGVNVIGVRPGLAAPGEQILVAAHYDHITGCTGADDNASGVAGILELARVVSLVDTNRTLIVACWDEEERGLVGSRAYAQRAAQAGDDIVAVWNYDMIGYKSDEPNSQTVPENFDLFFVLFREERWKFEDNQKRADFIFWIANHPASASAPLLPVYGEVVGLPTLGGVLPEDLENNTLLSDLRRSDHAPFWEVGAPAVFLSDTADLRYGGYHCGDGDDTVDRLDPVFSAQVIRATVGAVAELLQVR